MQTDEIKGIKDRLGRVESRLTEMDGKLDKLLECHGVEPESVLEKREKAEKAMNEIQDGLRRQTE